MEIQFVVGVTPIVSDAQEGIGFYRDTLGLPLEGEGDYLSSDQLGGVRHLGVWPLSMAAHSCFGTYAWPDHLPVPQATLEFELASPEAVAEAATELEEQGRRLLHGAKEEPWGQTVARLQGPEGLLIGLCYTPWMH
jgi:catechol 2,3-dioxygenase-like lactoylglutathione lyase family enzyme